MLGKLFRLMCQYGKCKHASTVRLRRIKFQPALEALEYRVLLSFAAPVSYNIGNQADGFVPNAAPVKAAKPKAEKAKAAPKTAAKKAPAKAKPAAKAKKPAASKK